MSFLFLSVLLSGCGGDTFDFVYDCRAGHKPATEEHFAEVGFSQEELVAFAEGEYRVVFTKESLSENEDEFAGIYDLIPVEMEGQLTLTYEDGELEYLPNYCGLGASISGVFQTVFELPALETGVVSQERRVLSSDLDPAKTDFSSEGYGVNQAALSDWVDQNTSIEEAVFEFGFFGRLNRGRWSLGVLGSSADGTQGGTLAAGTYTLERVEDAESAQ